MNPVLKPRYVLNHIEGHFISGYGDAEDRPEKQLDLIPAAAEKAESFLRDHPETRQRFDRVAELIEGYETPYGMELLSTVHWVATDEGASTPEETVAKAYAWNERKRIFAEEHIRVAWDTLDRRGWLSKA